MHASALRRPVYRAKPRREWRDCRHPRGAEVLVVDASLVGSDGAGVDVGVSKWVDVAYHRLLESVEPHDAGRLRSRGCSVQEVWNDNCWVPVVRDGSQALSCSPEVGVAVRNVENGDHQRLALSAPTQKAP